MPLSSAERSRRKRRNHADGKRVFSPRASKADLSDALVQEGFLPAWDAENDACIAAALEAKIAEWISDTRVGGEFQGVVSFDEYFIDLLLKAGKIAERDSRSRKRLGETIKRLAIEGLAASEPGDRRTHVGQNAKD